MSQRWLARGRSDRAVLERVARQSNATPAIIPRRHAKGRGACLALEQDQRPNYFVSSEVAAVAGGTTASCFALTASSRILIPSCDAATDFASESFHSAGLWNDAPLAAVHHSQFACASPCLVLAALSASSGT